MNKYLITGATGYIGSMLVKHLVSQSGDKEITAVVRDTVKAEKMLPRCVRLIRADITDAAAMSAAGADYNYIIHCACETKSANMVSMPIETFDGIVNGTRNVLDIAARCKESSMVYISSMEVYGNIDCSDGRRIKENELGSIDLFSARSSYPMSKRMAESLCFYYYTAHGVKVKVARPAQVFGKGVPDNETRIFAYVARCVAEKKDIVLNTTGCSMGNYCEIEDLIQAVMLLLKKGSDGEAYNIVNEENTMTIKDMAMLAAAKCAGGKINVTYKGVDPAQFGYAPETGLRLSGEKMRQLGWEPHKNIEQMYNDMIADIKQQNT